MALSEFFEPLLAGDNFTFIATNTTKYYLELASNYRDRFSDEASLLATAGVLDAQNYVFIEQTIGLSSIVDMAKEAALLEEGALVDFITQLEITIFKVDNPNIRQSDIVEACIGKKEEVANAVQRTKEEYISEPIFASVVSDFMSSPQFASYRQMLGIKD